ncbi:MAG: hypothetical protein HGB26_08950 [Desulfobulbaceae bacterium]|nr:hypothetical protein [Desulfobulbaceae bacterium]
MSGTANPNWLGIVIFLTPLVIGGVIAALNSDNINDATEKIEAWIREKQAACAAKTGKVFRFAITPPLTLIVKFSDWTDSFENRGWKNGARVAITLYLVGLWLFLIYFAVTFVVAMFLVVVGFIVVFKLIDFFSGDSDSHVTTTTTYYRPSRREEKELPSIGVRGQRVFTGTNFFNEELAGRVDNDGNIYKGSNFFNEEKIGRIDDDGNIFKGTNLFNEEKVGRIDEDGNIHKGSNWFTEEKVGRMDKDGNVYQGSNFFNEEKKGHVSK